MMMNILHGTQQQFGHTPQQQANPISTPYKIGLHLQPPSEKRRANPHALLCPGYKIQSQKQTGSAGMKRQEKQYLLLAVKSLSQNRRDKRYLLKIISLDHERQCEVESAFEHGYEYVYKLWPCLASEREFVKIEMLERVGDTLVKRGQASPLIRYSQDGERFQFAASKQEQCVLILKFRASTLAEVEKQLSSRELEKLNDRVELELIKNKHENENYHNYLEYTNKFLHFLDNTKYLDANPSEIDSQSSLKSTVILPEANKSLSSDSSLLGEFNTRMRKSLEILSNGKYFTQSPTIVNNMERRIRLPEINQQQNANQSAPPTPTRREESQKVSTEIRKRRNRYTKPPEQSRQEYMVEQTPLKHDEASPTSAEAIVPVREEAISPYQQYDQSHVIQAPIIRTNDFPLKQENTQMETSRRNPRRRKKNLSDNKQIKDSYSNALKRIEDVDLSKIFDRPRREDKGPKQDKAGKHGKQGKEGKQGKQGKEEKEVRMELFDLSLQLFRGDLTLPKKLIIEIGKVKYQTLPASIKNKRTEWPNRLVIPKSNATAVLHCKVVSVNEFSLFDEGETTIMVSDLIRCQSKTIKLYLNSSNTVIGLIDFQFKVSPFSSEEPSGEWPTLRINENKQKQRKSVSLPQISQAIRGAQRGKESKIGRPGTLSSHRKGQSKLGRHTQGRQRYSTSPGDELTESQQLLRVSNDKPSVLSRAKEKKARMRQRIK